MYETFEHTADLGLRVRAADLDTLFAEAAACLFSAIVDDLGTVRPLQCIDLEGAVLLTRGRPDQGILSYSMGSDGSGGDLLVLTGFGGGLAWGTALLRW